MEIASFSWVIRSTIEGQNNWKVGLQLLLDGYLGKYNNFDNMTQPTIIALLREYSLKYFKFLQIVIGPISTQTQSCGARSSSFS